MINNSAGGPVIDADQIPAILSAKRAVTTASGRYDRRAKMKIVYLLHSLLKETHEGTGNIRAASGNSGPRALV
jgi:hypothetical protein